MSGLKHLRSRIKSVASTGKITKAMQMVSAVKFKKARAKLEASLVYSEETDFLVKEIKLYYDLNGLGEGERSFFKEGGASKPKLFVFFSSERGLCGAFNSSLAKKMVADIEKLRKEGGDFKLIIIGKKGYDKLKNLYPEKIISTLSVTKEFKDSEVLAIVLGEIISLTEKEEISSCCLYYNKFKNAMVQIPSAAKILPIEITQGEDMGAFREREYEGGSLVRRLIGLYLLGRLKAAFLESSASEEGARTSAMDSATKNASDLIDGLTLALNRTRQASITKELIEIVSGAEAL